MLVSHAIGLLALEGVLLRTADNLCTAHHSWVMHQHQRGALLPYNGIHANLG